MRKIFLKTTNKKFRDFQENRKTALACRGDQEGLRSPHAQGFRGKHPPLRRPRGIARVQRVVCVATRHWR